MVATLRRGLSLAITGLVLCGAPPALGASLTAGFVPVPERANVDLTAEGTVDWAHWGLFNETTVNRKATVTPLISDIEVVDATNGSAFLYRYADNYNGYSWNDGSPRASVTNTPTGVWVYGTPNIGSGFEITAPADTSVKTLKVFVGTFAARGRFTASLSDASAPSYTDSSLSNMGNGPGAVYTIDYAAGSAGQYLTLRWVLTQAFRPDGNVTLQAAALDAPGANNPPFVQIRNPQENSTFTASANVAIDATAFDPDGTVSRVEFYEGATRIGEDGDSPYTATWSNTPPGNYVLAARVTDNAGTTSTSAPVRIFVNDGGGSLLGRVALPPAGVDLTAEGTADWTHWGIASPTSFNRKAGVPPQISNFTQIGKGAVERYADNFTAYAWTDGTPTSSTNGTKTGVFIHGLTDGFLLTAAADTSPRTLKVYVGLYGAQGNFQAYLSDLSAPAYTDTSLQSVLGNAYAVYTLDYVATAAHQTITVRYTAKALHDARYGNVTLQAATLFGGSAPTNAPPSISITLPTSNATFAAPANITISADASDSDGSVTQVEFFADAAKLGEVASPPFSLNWSNVAAGSYTLTAKATDNQSASTVSSTVSVTVTNASPASITLINPSTRGGKFQFSFPAQAGASYTVQFTDSLNPINWQTLTNLTGTGIPAETFDPNPAGTERYYRVGTP